MEIQQGIRNKDTLDNEWRYKGYRMDIQGIRNGDTTDKEWEYKG